MPRPHTPLPPLWYIKSRVQLSDRYPSGLEWVDTANGHVAGEMAGVWKQALGRYMVSIGGIRYYAHRLVYYLRTGEDPGARDVLHTEDNMDRDNRKELLLYQRPQPKLQQNLTRLTCDL